MGLAPEQVEAMGQGVADTYRAIVDAVVATLSAQVEAALKEGASWPELLQMADDVRKQAYEQIRDMSKDVRDEVMREVSEALTASLADDLERMGMADELQKVQSATVAATAGTPVRAALGQATAATVSGVMAIVARDNLAMAQDAQSTFLNVSSRYVSLCNAGALSYPDALKRAVSELAERGVGVVEYASGVRNQADVAVLRHLRSQTVQAGNARTMDLCDRYGCKLVEVSSHIGARPSHADWQGQVYRLTDDDPELVAKYEDFWEATGYEGIKGDHARLGDRLCGVNCRHSFAPYIEGTERVWSPTPDEDAGLDRDEVYKATQKQRSYERQIRQTKREIAALEDAGADASAKRARLRLQQKRLRTLVDENSAYLRRQSWRESVNGYRATGFKAVSMARSKGAQHVTHISAKTMQRAIDADLPIFDAGTSYGAMAAAGYGALCAGGYAVVAHGKPEEGKGAEILMEVFGELAQPSDVAKIILKREDYTKGTPVRLIACDTGKEAGGRTFAQLLANALGVTVYAPTDTLWLKTRGRFSIGATASSTNTELEAFEPEKG